MRLYAVEGDFKWPIGDSWIKDPVNWLVVECEGGFDPDDNTIGDLKLAFALPLGTHAEVMEIMAQITCQYAAIASCAVQTLCEKAREERRSA